MPDVTPEGIARRRAERRGEKVQGIFGWAVAGLFILAIFACSFLFKLVFVGVALR